MPKKKLPIVVIVGRTNVGKSTLFNRILEKPKALVSDIAGTTRDRNEGECLWRGQVVRIVDTGGLDVNLADEIERNILTQTKYAIRKADVIVFVLDFKSELLPQEIEAAKTFVASGKPVIVVGNKAEKISERMRVNEKQWHLPNLPEPMAISALRGTGVGDLLDRVWEELARVGAKPQDAEKIVGTRVAVIGKPNVGKSTLLNALLGEERFITSPVAHTTREPNDVYIEVNGKPYIFIDTAGMRKKGKVRRAGGLEAAAIARNKKVIENADVTLLVVEAHEPIGTQERTLAGMLKDAGTGLVIIVNKWDLVEDKTPKTINRYKEYIQASFPFLKWANILFISALEKQRVKNIFALIDETQINRSVELSNQQLDEFLQSAMKAHAPKRGKGPKPPKVLGLVQHSTKPPKFDLVLRAKRTDEIAPAYISYLQNRIREHFGLSGTPIRIQVKTATSVSK